jgi:hypothetical protein
LQEQLYALLKVFEKKMDMEHDRLYCVINNVVIVYVFMFQFLVLASDQRSPPHISNATMTIRIRRNAAPVFDRLPETTTVSENVANNFVVYTVTARDADMRVL